MQKILGGDLTVENCAEAGACFQLVIHLKAAVDELIKSVSITKKVVSKISLFKKPFQQREQLLLLLLVDDHADIRKFIQKLETDFQIIEAENGAEGFELAKQFIPDLIVSDIMMPQVDGVELLEKLKNDKKPTLLGDNANSPKVPMQQKLRRGKKAQMPIYRSHLIAKNSPAIINSILC